MQSALRFLLFWVVRLLLRPVLSQHVPVGFQRRWGGVIGLSLLGPRGARYSETHKGEVPLMLVEPAQHDATHAVLLLHGGAFVMGGYGSHRKLAAAIGGAANARVCLPDYRLAPEHPQPAAVKDSLAVYAALLEEGQDPARLSLVGDSAGGNLVLELALAIREAGLPMPACIVLISPWTDLSMSGETIVSHKRRDPMLSSGWLSWAAKAYCGAATSQDPVCSPLFADLGGLPPVLIQLGSEEILLSDAYRLAARLKATGVACTLREFNGMWHVFQLHYGVLREADLAIEQIGNFILDQQAGVNAARPKPA